MSPSAFPCILELQDRSNARVQGVQFFQNFTQKEEKDSFEHDNWLRPNVPFLCFAYTTTGTEYMALGSSVSDNERQMTSVVFCQISLLSKIEPISWTASMNRVLCIGPEMLNGPLFYNFEHKDI